MTRELQKFFAAIKVRKTESDLLYMALFIDFRRQTLVFWVLDSSTKCIGFLFSAMTTHSQNWLGLQVAADSGEESTKSWNCCNKHHSANENWRIVKQKKKKQLKPTSMKTFEKNQIA
ncbi:CLUMA_CG020127, isoform A [Clunio marinus]|uniref:CLUMA_CG020127, isoform A n=1 Tax=Clunio marinus TaxID=568069 RepID=A0A1J1J5S8_9DIPT|nr:CLUMA_CG020127, isoform A [Clunio marinus]